ncbi:MAG TPA: outer membrane protein assembly factor BamD [Spirochaetota bacterium]|nr:outer membrane protein assembly factor BamD [Spirochaetota bacterium]
MDRFNPIISSLLAMLSSIILLTPPVTGQGARTEEILKTIISGGKVPQEPLPVNADPISTRKRTISRGSERITSEGNASPGKKSTAKKQAGAGTADDALYRTGVDFFNSGMYEAAVKSFAELKSKHPQSAQLHSAMIYSGKANMRLRDYKKAIDDMSVVPTESGEYPASLFHQAEARLGMGNRADAIALFSRVAVQFPQTALADDSLIRAGQVYLDDGKGRQALDSAVRVIRHYGDRETVDDAYFLVGQVYEKDPEVRDVEVSRKVYKVFIGKAESGEKHFDKSPLLRRVKRELRELESRYFRYEK